MNRFTRTIPVGNDTDAYEPLDAVDRDLDYAANTGWFTTCPVRLTRCGEPAGRYGDNQPARRLQAAR